MACIPPNPRRVGNIVPIHGPLDGPLYMSSHIHQQLVMIITSNYRLHSVNLTIKQSNSSHKVLNRLLRQEGAQTVQDTLKRIIRQAAC